MNVTAPTTTGTTPTTLTPTQIQTLEAQASRLEDQISHIQALISDPDVFTDSVETDYVESIQAQLASVQQDLAAGTTYAVQPFGPTDQWEEIPAAVQTILHEAGVTSDSGSLYLSSVCGTTDQWWDLALTADGMWLAEVTTHRQIILKGALTLEALLSRIQEACGCATCAPE